MRQPAAHADELRGRPRPPPGRVLLRSRGLIQRATTFHLGESFVAGKFVRIRRTSGSASDSREGGADIPTSWAAPGDPATPLTAPGRSGAVLRLQTTQCGKMFTGGQTVGQPPAQWQSKRPCTCSRRHTRPHSQAEVLPSDGRSRVQMRDSNGDSNAPSPTVVRQRPLTREHGQNRHCGHRCWLLLISGLAVNLLISILCQLTDRATCYVSWSSPAGPAGAPSQRVIAVSPDKMSHLRSAPGESAAGVLRGDQQG